MIFSYPNPAAGFTLVEVLVAISILLLALIGPMNVITQSNNSSAFAAEQTQAFFFAQEGVELARKVRDDLQLAYFNDEFNNSGALNLEPFVDFIDTTSSPVAACFTTDGCGLTIDDSNPANVIVTSCNTGDCRLYERSSAQRSKYVHVASGNTQTPYTRVIRLREVNGDEVEVTSTVKWRTGSLIASQEVVVGSYLFDVYDTD